MKKSQNIISKIVVTSHHGEGKKKVQNHDRELFLCPPQNTRIHNQHFKMIFFKINLHIIISN